MNPSAESTSVRHPEPQSASSNPTVDPAADAFTGPVDGSEILLDGVPHRVTLVASHVDRVPGGKVQVRHFRATPVAYVKEPPAQRTSKSKFSAKQPRRRTKPSAKSQSNHQSKAKPASPSREHRHQDSPAPQLPPTSGKNGRVQILVRTRSGSAQVAMLDGPTLVEFNAESGDELSAAGEIYVGVVTSVVPAMSAAFVDVGFGKNGILHVQDLSPACFGSNPSSIGVLKKGSRLLVQVTRDGIGHKGPRLTNRVTLSGRLLVLMPFAFDGKSESSAVGVSKKLPPETRSKVRERLMSVTVGDANVGLIARSAAMSASESDLRREAVGLLARWTRILKRAGLSAETATSQPTVSEPMLVSNRPNRVVEMLKDRRVRHIRRILVDDAGYAAELRDALESVEPKMAEAVQVYDEPEDLFTRFRVHDQLRVALDRVVATPSGATVVFDHAEAATVIDVNSAKFTSSGSLAETALKVNLEAATVIAQQLRLRAIGGLIIIDFIDMASAEDRAKLNEHFRAELAEDPTYTKALKVSEMGLVEMVRKRVSTSLVERFSVTCDHCNGRGVLVNDQDLLG